ncbi:MAG: hypothetical protein KatS3mg115_1436 [Candidatus Poribacteria bacterium]|nr:MAG: hypothetical protein KatS3mg115_1436 [Candidatus Poribacteria bacterium]
MLGFETDGALGAKADPEPNLFVSADDWHHFKHTYTPTNQENVFEYQILVDDGATGEVAGTLNVGTLRPNERLSLL